MLAGASAIEKEKVQVHLTSLVNRNEPDAKSKFPCADFLFPFPFWV